MGEDYREGYLLLSRSMRQEQLGVSVDSEPERIAEPAPKSRGWAANGRGGGTQGGLASAR